MIPARGTSKVSEADLALLARVRSGDPKAEQELVIRFEPLLRWRLGRTLVRPEVLSHEDLLQFYRIRLLLCARAWSPDRGAAFTTYLLTALWNCEHNECRRARPGGLMDTGDNVPEVYSLDLLFGESETETLKAFLPDPHGEQAYVRIEVLDWVQSVLKDAPEQLETLVRHYGLDGGSPLMNKEIAETAGVGKQGVTYRVKRALKTLRKHVHEVDLGDVLVRKEGSL